MNDPQFRRGARAARWRAAVGAALMTFAAAAAAAPVDSSADTPRGVIARPGAVVAPDQTGQRPPSDGTTLVDPSLYSALGRGERRDFVIELRSRADLSAAFAMPWRQRGRYVHETLVEHAKRTQRRVIEQLRASGADFEPFWIKNAIRVRGGSLATLDSVSRLSEVERVRVPPRPRLIEPQIDTHVAAKDAPAGTTPNIDWVDADEAWAQGITGAGVSVGVIDSGVFYLHEALREAYRGRLDDGGYAHDYHWFDPTGFFTEPASYGAHGTHVTGVIVGDNHADDPAQRRRIGMAPGARWVGCLGFPYDGDVDAALLGCGQFMLAPTDRAGENPDPDLRPEIVNNSWGDSLDCDGDPSGFYADMIDAWVAAGVVPVFSAGNASNCGFPPNPPLASVSNPGSQGATFTVGSTGNADGAYAPHSLLGPTTDPAPGLPTHPDPMGWPNLKPQVVAPGVNILSAVDFGGIDVYESAGWTGTSMSAPHVSGLMALMIDAGSCLRGDYATLGTLVMQTARGIDYDSGGDPAPGPGNVPNYATGWGEIDAAAAVAAAGAACGPQGTLRGRVTDTAGAPIAGARVRISGGGGTRDYVLETDTAGEYVRRLPAGEGYLVEVSRHGYIPGEAAGVPVSNGSTSRADLTLAAAVSYPVQGRVVDAATGMPLHARLRIAGAGIDPVWTDPVSGTYSVRLYEQSSYRIDVDSDIAGYRATHADVVDLDGPRTLDFALVADPVACAAPGYAFATDTLLADFESQSLPAGWSATSQGAGWQFDDSDALWSWMLPIPPAGNVAAANDELAGESNDGSEDWLITPSLSLAALGGPVLRYGSYYTGYGGSIARVLASVDGGPWQPLDAPQETPFPDEPAWETRSVDLAAFAGEADVRLAFHSDDSGWGEGMIAGGWAIDDVRLGADCTPPAGGALVIGRVRDANTGLGLDGVQVSADGRSVMTSTPDDAALGSGYFRLFVGSGTQSVEAAPPAEPVGYGPVSRSVDVTAFANRHVDLAMPAGELRFFGEGPSAELVLDTQTTGGFDVRNAGTLPVALGFEALIAREDFESPFPPEGWTVVDHLGEGCVWLRSDVARISNTAGGDGFAAAAFQQVNCGVTAEMDSSLVSPAFDLSTGDSASLQFVLSFGAFGSAQVLSVDVSADGGASWATAWSLSGVDIDPDGPGAPIGVDLTPWLGEPAVQVRLRFVGPPLSGSAVVDQIRFFGDADVAPMLDLDPSTLPLAAQSNARIDAMFDGGSVEQPGTYAQPVRVAHDTPYDVDDLVARMTVTPPAHYGAIAGTVRSLGSCDAHPLPAAGATVRITHGSGEFVTQTDAEGRYVYWMDAAQGPFDVEASYDDHVARSEHGIAVSAGATTPLDLDLRVWAPCLTVQPQALSVSVEPGESASRAFDLANAGTVDTAWHARVGGDPDAWVPDLIAQTDDPDPEPNVSVGCVVAGETTALENSYMRAFDMLDESFTDDTVQISAVHFAVDSAQAGPELDGVQTVNIRLYSLEGILYWENLTPLAQTTAEITDGGQYRVRAAFDAPVSVPTDAMIVAEIHVPDAQLTGNTFFPGGNSNGQLLPGFWAANDCGIGQPTFYTDLGLDFIHLILELEILEKNACSLAATPVPWLSLDGKSGMLMPETSAALEAGFSSTGLAEGVHRGSLCFSEAPDGEATLALPAELGVGVALGRIFGDGFE